MSDFALTSGGITPLARARSFASPARKTRTQHRNRFPVGGLSASFCSRPPASDLTFQTHPVLRNTYPSPCREHVGRVRMLLWFLWDVFPTSKIGFLFSLDTPRRNHNQNQNTPTTHALTHTLTHALIIIIIITHSLTHSLTHLSSSDTHTLIITISNTITITPPSSHHHIIITHSHTHIIITQTRTSDCE